MLGRQHDQDRAHQIRQMSGRQYVGGVGFGGQQRADVGQHHDNDIPVWIEAEISEQARIAGSRFAEQTKRDRGPESLFGIDESSCRSMSNSSNGALVLLAGGGAVVMVIVCFSRERLTGRDLQGVERVTENGERLEKQAVVIAGGGGNRSTLPNVPAVRVNTPLAWQAAGQTFGCGDQVRDLSCSAQAFMVRWSTSAAAPGQCV
jgi:hypothetical protein